MKLIKFGILAAAATLILGAFSAKATPYIGTVTSFSKLNILLVITTNGTSVFNGHATKYPTGTVKITNKQLLDLFAEWDNTTWPAGAQLVQGWDEQWDGHVLVVDKTGNNVLYDAIGDDSSHYFEINIDTYSGSYSGTDDDSDPGTYSIVAGNYCDFYLYDDNYFLPYTYLYAYGAGTQKFSISWNSIGDTTKWSDSETFNATYADLDFLNNIDTSFILEVKSSGHGSVTPWFLDN